MRQPLVVGAQPAGCGRGGPEGGRGARDYLRARRPAGAPAIDAAIHRAAPGAPPRGPAGRRRANRRRPRPPRGERGVTALLVAVAAAVAALAVWAILAREQLAERLRPRSRTLEPGPKRILFLFVGTALSRTALDAALRLCRAEGATLVPAYLAQVPMTLPLNSSLPPSSPGASDPGCDRAKGFRRGGSGGLSNRARTDLSPRVARADRTRGLRQDRDCRRNERKGRLQR